MTRRHGWNWLGGFLAWALVLAGGSGACATGRDIGWTRGRVRFATSERAFYKGRWKRRIRTDTRRLCAGFVHKEKFERFLKYGRFVLKMTLDVYKGGTPVFDRAGEIVGWRGGRHLRTIRRTRAIRPNQDAYLWCATLRKGAVWKEGGMKYRFWLHRDEPPKDVFLAEGWVQVLP